jgi:hypothetical protein
MATRRSRFLDSVVLAAALTAAGAGITAAVGLLIDGGKAKAEMKASMNRDRCSRAFQYLQDETVNKDLSPPQRSKLTQTAYDIMMSCSKDD